MDGIEDDDRSLHVIARPGNYCRDSPLYNPYRATFAQKPQNWLTPHRQNLQLIRVFKVTQMPEGVILVALDREDDVLLIREALIKAKIPYPVYIVRDGEEVIEYLNGQGKYANRAEFPLPDLLLLDLKMPRKDGLEVLQWLRQQQSQLRTLRVVVLTTAADVRDVHFAYWLGANSFLVKPLDFTNFEKLGELISSYELKLELGPRMTEKLFPIVEQTASAHVRN